MCPVDPIAFAGGRKQAGTPESATAGARRGHGYKPMQAGQNLATRDRVDSLKCTIAVNTPARLHPTAQSRLQTGELNIAQEGEAELGLPDPGMSLVEGYCCPQQACARPSSSSSAPCLRLRGSNPPKPGRVKAPGGQGNLVLQALLVADCRLRRAATSAACLASLSPGFLLSFRITTCRPLHDMSSQVLLAKGCPACGIACGCDNVQLTSVAPQHRTRPQRSCCICLNQRCFPASR